MKDYVALWSENLMMRRSATLKSSAEVTGEYDKHLGPTWAFASADIIFEPSPFFEFVDATDQQEEVAENGYGDWLVFGLLDVLMISSLRNIRIRVMTIRHDSIKSSQWAFREAGRDAARKLVALNLLQN
jgi:hypothetical protein